ncbi:MAG: GNAT family N-acetyltransferase [Myxococcota bacterium]
MSALKVETVGSVRDVAAAEWDACAPSENPFLHHAFLLALEESGSVGPRTGWEPCHLVARRGKDVVGVAPTYVKTHSWGEYVFDQGWAQALTRAGGSYYPKLQVAVPFTPVTGPRLLARPGEDEVVHALAEGAVDLARRRGLSSVHVTFPVREQWELLGREGWLQRTGVQFFWDNHGYTSFDDFLAALSSRKRKMVRKEREQASRGLTLRTLQGHDVTEAHLQAMHTFYGSTVDRKWGSAYLTRKFFPLLHQRMPGRVVLTMAFDEEKPVAGAFHLLGDDTLYGRHWGCSSRYEFLHFECCYYQAMDLAIARGLRRVEAGAQGVHKVSRGYLPAHTYSAHWLLHDGLRDAVARFLDAERVELDGEIQELMTLSPFRQEPG